MMEMRDIDIQYQGEVTTLSFHTKRVVKRMPIGRTDKNGTPIKEGDIISNDGKLHWGGVVTYSIRGCGFAFDYRDIHQEEYTFSSGWASGQESRPEDDWVIIGSIYK